MFRNTIRAEEFYIQEQNVTIAIYRYFTACMDYYIGITFSVKHNASKIGTICGLGTTYVLLLFI